MTEFMTEERKGQIALVLLKAKLGTEGIQLKPELKRELGNLSQKTGISMEELKEFGKILITEMAEEAFGNK